MKQLIELWETFLMQLDAEEDEGAFYKPPVEPAARASTEITQSEANSEDSHAPTIAADDSD